MEWKDLLTAVGALVGLISALVTAAGTIAAYKEKKAERAVAAGQPIRILSLKDRRAPNLIVLMVKVIGYATIGLTPPFLLFFLFALHPSAPEIVVVVAMAAVLNGLYIFLLRKVRGDLTARRSRTKRDATISVQGSYDAVFGRCQDAVLRLKATIVTLDFDSGVIESERMSNWHIQFILNVKVTKIDDTRCSIYVETDASVPTALFDFGVNARRLRRFMSQLSH